MGSRFFDTAKKNRFLIATLLFYTFSFLYMLPHEPIFFSNDEQKHSTDAIFFKDLYIQSLKDPSSLLNLKQYVLGYYMNAPSLGLGYYPPLYAMVSGFVSLFLDSDIALKLVNFLFGLMLILILFRFCEKFFNTLVAYLACLAMLYLSPFFVFSKLNMLDVPCAAILLLGLYFYFNDRSYRSGLAFGLAFWTRWDAVLLIPIVVLHCLVERRYGKCAMVLSSFTMLSAPLLLLSWKFGIADTLLSYLFGASGGQKPFALLSLRNIVDVPYVLLSTTLFSIPFVMNLLGRARSWRLDSISTFASLLFLFDYIIYTFARHVVHPRFLLVLFAFVLIYGADFLVEFAKQRRRTAAIICVVFLLYHLSLPIPHLGGGPQNTRGITEALIKQNASDVLLLTDEQSFIYYAQSLAPGRIKMTRYDNTLFCADISWEYRKLSNVTLNDFALGFSHVVLDEGFKDINISEFDKSQFTQVYVSAPYVVYKNINSEKPQVGRCVYLCKQSKKICEAPDGRVEMVSI